MDSVYAAFVAAATRYGDRPFLHIPRQATKAYAAGPVDYSYAEAAAAVASISARYRALGLVAGDRVALGLENRAEALLHFLALNQLGVSIVPINIEQRTAEKAYLLGHSEAVLVVAFAEHHADLRAALDQLGSAVQLVTPALAGATPLTATYPPAVIDPALEAALLYTSGTTGKPKGCMLSNLYFLEVGRQYVAMGALARLEPGIERIITPLPLSHMNALCCTPMAMILTGGCLIQLDRFHASTWWETVRESGATCLHYLGVMPAILLNHAASPEDNLAGQVKFGFGAGVDPRHQQIFEERFGFPLIEAWAMTETGAGGWISMHDDPRLLGQRCIGRPLDHMEVRLVDEADADVAEGEPGELLVRTCGDDPRRYFFSGYFGDPAATEEAWRGGWFHTGDVVRRDTHGNYFFVDRRKNVIRRSGENIAAVEVEWSLFQHPAVDVCAVVPVDDDIRGEEVMALVIAAPGTDADATTALDIARHCASQLVYFKAPGYVAFVPSLPMTVSQKIQRAEVKQMARALLAEGKAIDLRDHKRGTRRTGG